MNSLIKLLARSGLLKGDLDLHLVRGSNDSGQWFRSYGNELWEFDDDGLMRRREASTNDVAITETERRFLWPAPGPRPADHPGIPNIR
jgi:hypothetical protein